MSKGVLPYQQLSLFDHSPTPVSLPEKLTGKDGFFVSLNWLEPQYYGCTCDTTVLVDKNMARFLLLNGNHLEQYAAIIHQGYQACVNYFLAHISQANKYTNYPKDRFLNGFDLDRYLGLIRPE